MWKVFNHIGPLKTTFLQSDHAEQNIKMSLKPEQ